MQKFLNHYYKNIYESLLSAQAQDLKLVADIFHKTKKNGGKIILCGNGGSAAMASHVAVDLTKAARYRATNFSDADLITCFANDFCYENWVAKAVEYYGDYSDTLVLISSSGSSKNILLAADKGREIGLSIVTLSGFSNDNPLRNLGDVNLWVDSKSYNIVEMTHHVWLLAVVDYLIESNILAN